jgi:hypothetical protein
MGGVSDGTFEPCDDGCAVFSGTLRPGPSGAFASVRSPLMDVDLSPCAGLSLQLCGDGRRYKLSLRTQPSFDGVQYQSSFATARGAWTEIRIPFERFAPTFRGREATDAPALDKASIRSFGLLIGDGQAGSFLLKIRRISTFP